MNKFLTYLMLALTLGVAGCNPSTSPVNFPLRPAHLQDCSFDELSNGQNRILVVRCPNSTVSTSYMEGKERKNPVTISGDSPVSATQPSSITINGVVYEPKRPSSKRQSSSETSPDEQ